jgi:hypothetical protein
MAFPTTFVPQSLLATQTLMQNFCPQLSASLAVSGTSNSVTFAPLTGNIRQTFKITNKGSHGAYLAWGSGSATAVASSSTPAAQCDYIAAGAILTQDFQVSAGICDTIAAIQDSGSTTLEITVGFGQ